MHQRSESKLWVTNLAVWMRNSTNKDSKEKKTNSKQQS